MLLRKLFKFLRGGATPLQIWLSCLLASLIGFMPGFAHAPGLCLFLLALLVVLNANLFLAGLVFLGAKLLSWLLLPVSFAIGGFLIDGPLSGLWTLLINGPVTAWFGFENYVASGGLVLGLLFGVLMSLLVTGLLQSLRRTLGRLENDSAAYQKWTSKGWVKVVAWILIGGLKGKKSFDELASAKMGNPIRPLGAVLVAGLAVLAGVLVMLLDSMILTVGLRSALERVNGATVDVQEVALEKGTLTITGLAMADPNQLDRNLFSAESMTAAVSGSSLLRKRVALDKLEIVGASTGEPRRVPGRLTEPKPKPPEPEPDEAGEGRPLQDYLKDAVVWKERLAQAQSWLERLSPPRDDAAPADAPRGPSLADQLREQADLLGYARVVATHRIEGAPTLLIRLLQADKVKVAALPDTHLTISGSELSTQPWLHPEGPKLSIQSDDDKMGFAWQIPAAQSAGSLAFHYRGLPVDELRAQATQSDSFPISGGTIDVAADGPFSLMALDLPVTATVRNTRVAGTNIPQVQIPLKLSGSLGNPRVTLDPESLQKALLQAGQGAVVDRLQQEAGRALQKQGGDKLREAAGGALGGLLGGQRE